MKRTITKRALSFLLAFTLLFSSVVVFNTSAASGTKTAEIVSQNVYYGDTLKLMYAVKTENLTSSDKVSVKLYNASGEELETITSYTTETVNGEECLVFTSAYGVPAQSIDTEISAKAVVTSGSSTVYTGATLKYSVLEYLHERLTVSKDNGKVSADQEAMYEGLIEYAGLAENVLTNKAEADKIANYSYVSVNNGTVGGENGVLYKSGTVVKNFAHSIESPTYDVIWQVDEFDKSGDYIDSYALTDTEFTTNGYTVKADRNAVISARENAITEADVLAQIPSFGNPSNWHVNTGTYSIRACVRFTFPVKSGTTFTLKEEYRSDYQIALNFNDNPEYKDTDTQKWYDLGWASSDTQSASSAHEGLYPTICFIHEVKGSRQDIAFTQDEVENLVTMIEVVGEKATVNADRGSIQREEFERQTALIGSVPMPNARTRARIAFSIKMEAGTKINFVGKSSVYDWAVTEVSNTGSVEHMLDTGWLNGATTSEYTTKINGSYIVITISHVDDPNTLDNPDTSAVENDEKNSTNFERDILDNIYSMFTVNGKKYYDNGASVEVKDYKVNSVNHRGYVTAPENTLPAYELSAKKGFTAVECDVSFTKDGYAVLLHDDTIDRTSNGTGSISSMTLAQVKQYDFGSWKSPEYAGTQIPTFEEFIALCAELDLHPYIEIKVNENSPFDDTRAEALVGIVNKYGLLDNCTWISFNSGALASVLKCDDTARVGYLVGGSAGITDAFITTAQGLQTGKNEVFLDVWYGFATTTNSAYSAANVDKVEAAGLGLEVYTVNDANIVKALDSYVTGITTDFIIAGKYLG